MTATLDSTAVGLQRANAELQRQLDECRAELAARNSQYGERIKHQAATNDVLTVMSASPGDPQPVFDLIVERARDLCDGYGVTVYEFDGTLIHWRAATGVSDDPSARQALEAMYPMAPMREFPSGRAILDRQIIHIRDMETEPWLSPAMRGLTVKSSVSVPLIRGGAAIGALVLGCRERGGFSDSQVELLKTFAEQAVIAVTSAETYRELQQRTGELARSEAELRGSEERHALVSLAVAEGIYDWDIGQNRLWVSPRLIELFGWEAGEGIGERPRIGTPGCTPKISRSTVRRCGRP
jgi:GAF domain-containing protein